MSQRIFSPPNAILFIYDPANKNAETPEYSADSLVSATKDCISVGTRAYVDGDTTVKLFKSSADVDVFPRHRLFDGFIDTPNRKIAVITSELDVILEIVVQNEIAKIGIWTDDLHNPGTLLITAE